MIECLLAFTRSKDQQLQTKALKLLVICARELKQRPHMVANFPADHRVEYQLRDSEMKRQSDISGIR